MLPRSKALLGFAAISALLAAGGAYYLWPSTPEEPKWVAEYDVAARAPAMISPGTVIGEAAPEGWTHLIIKSLPRVRPTEERNIPGHRIARSETIQMSRWMFTAFVANIQPETHGNKTHYQLQAIALGLGTSVDKRDVIITPETAAAHGVKLGWASRTILVRGYETLRHATIVVKGPTFAIVDTPVWYRCGKANRLIRFRYALLVDAGSGELTVLVWMLDLEGGCGDTGTAAVLDPNTIDMAELIPDPSKFNLLGIPTDDGFGVDQLPPHREKHTLSAEVQTLAKKTNFSAADASTLEDALRLLIHP